MKHQDALVVGTRTATENALLVGTPMALEALFVAGKLVEPTRLLTPEGLPCEWSVVIRTGLIFDMSGRLLSHRKRYYVDVLNGGRIRGVNVFRSSLYWGYHDVQPGWGLDGRVATVLDYNVRENTFTRSVVDRVRTTEDPDLLVGKLYVGDWFGGYFTLARKKP